MIKYDIEALEYISKLCDGHLRDAITLLDKCLSYSVELTIENVVKALGTVDYEEMIQLTNCILSSNIDEAIVKIEILYSGGKDIKQFLKQYLHFLLDAMKYLIGCDWEYIKIPKTETCEKWLEELDKNDKDVDTLSAFIKKVVELDSNIKYSATPRYDIEAMLLLFGMEGKE